MNQENYLLAGQFSQLSLSPCVQKRTDNFVAMEPPKIPTVFKGVKNRPRGFNFTPRHYNREKEDFEKRVRQAKKESELEEQKSLESRLRMEDAIQDSWGSRHTPIHDNGRTRRLSIIFIGLIICLYAFYRSYF